jgi:hypothetical protein|tara:strand:- start:2114 stop:2317 length:204 start_codon:yes stop_codon:yes gene_type:complete
MTKNIAPPNPDELNNRIKLLGKKVNTIMKVLNELKSENKDLKIKLNIVMKKNYIYNDRTLEQELKTN